ncbi:T9SS type A sorting domain-containing protein [Aquimarina litoralis]|uniref:T9SS type A sorting domain-containing protein n=1 Tax=Aquimarina litoralis TaxID=584605 RepID=UPI001C58315A|nr:T9SS type A sorting domain-containing protein [Aquimarina litoralis]MBW1296248.1 T9SS type A sorting domain-containing protein [Aquimarina litoralis]
MKKVTLIYFLFVISLGFSQSITWNNPVNSVAPGQTINMDVSYDAGSEDFFYVSIILREVDASFNIVNDYNQIFPIDENSGQQPNAQNNVTFDYTIDANAPNSTSLPSGNQYLLIIFMSYNNDGGFVNDNTSITLDSTLSVSSFDSQERFTGFYPNPVNDVLYFNNDVVSDQYRILDFTGRVVKTAKNTASLNVQELTAGTYFIETEKGVGKFVKI